ncbi:DUF1285 domain-containing protein [Pseudomonas sp. HK3]
MDLTVLSGQLGKYLDMPSDLPPVDKWNPDLSGNIDMVIKADGQWLHENNPIKREKLTRLFSTILKREQNDYFLVTPVEKWRLQVEDQPFVIVLMHQSVKNGVNLIQMITNTGDEIELNSEHPLVLDDHEAPKILVRSNMYARLNRNVFYAIAEIASEKNGHFFVKSSGDEFQIG